MPFVKTEVARDSFGRDVVVSAPMGGSSKTLVSPNMCDRYSWWWDATSVVDETLTDSGDGLTFNSANAHWIDPTSIVDSHEVDSIQISVTADGSPVTSGFTIDHSAGTITFDASKAGSVVIASYAHGGTPLWEIEPASGKILRILKAEVQLSKDFVFNADILFEILLQVAPDTWVVVGQNRYKNAKDFVGRANKGYTIPAFGELTQDVVVMPFEYPAVIDLEYVYHDNQVTTETPAMKLRVRLSDEVEMGGEFGCVALYCVSEAG